jgi:hypothetical protein
MKLILASFLSLLSVAHAQWPQTEFVIGALHDPELTGVATNDEQVYRTFRDANFNTLSGQYSRGEGGVKNPEARPWELFTGTSVSNSYKLARIAAVGGLKMFVDDWDVSIWNTTFNSPRAINNYSATLPTASRAAHAGYIPADEPHHDNQPGGDARTTMTNALLRQSRLNTGDPSRLAWFPLGAIWMTNTGANDLTAYAAYVDSYVNDPSTRVISFDYYAFNTSTATNSWGVNGFTAYGGPREVTYYRSIGIYADRVRTALNNGRVLNYWGIPNAVDHEPDGPGSLRRHPIPTLERANYEMFSHLAYGAKGIFWFTYGLPDDANYHASAQTDATIYANIKAVNLTLKSMGPTLMRLNRLTTVHGTSRDPASLEPGLPTLSSETNRQSVLVSQTIPGNIEIGIFVNPGNKDNYLIVHNKSITASSTVTLTVNGLVYVKKHTKVSDSWRKVTATYDKPSRRTSFTLTLPKGDGELIWLGKNRLPFLTPALVRRDP